MTARTFGELAQQRQHPMQASCSFCKKLKDDCIKYSTRHYVCGSCLEPRRDALLPAIARAQAQARAAAARFVAQLKEPATWDEIDREANFLNALYRCGEAYARECVDAAVSSARRKGGR